MEATKKESTKLVIRRRYLFLIGVLVGLFAFFVFRFATVSPNVVHYHADFALYVNGQKDEFKSFTFYEEVQACSADDHNNVKARAHMHDSKAGLVHVHDEGVTWGQFFANLGYTLGDTLIATDKGVFIDEQEGNELMFVINGKTTDSLANEVIHSEDKLLISYGNEDAKTLDSRFSTISNEAHTANTKNDPATCSGGKPLTFTGRLKAAIGLNDR
jgi:hypothetical protein